MVVMVENSCVSLSVGQTFDSFSDFLAALAKVKNEGYHPFRVFNSQKGEDYNRKRLTRKFPGDPVDVKKYSTHITVFDVYILESIAKEVKD